MIIKSVTIGGWFQRTTLHLSEVFYFINNEEIKGLDKKILQKNLKALNVHSFEKVTEELESIKVDFANNLSLSFAEDGLVTLSLKEATSDLALVKQNIDKIKNFYEMNFSPSISYIFSRGAPVPKELAKIENIYPFILEVETQNEKNIFEVFEKLHDEVTGVVKEGEVEIYKGRKIFVINNLKNEKEFKIFSETEIFWREFKTQLSRYLHIHRELWEKINKIKEMEKVSGGEVLDLRKEIQEEQKTINLIESRINQMPTYLKTRQKFTNALSTHKNINNIFQYKFETLLNTHDYIKSLWAMTKNYLNSANDMLGVVQSESTKTSISSLTLITTIGVVAGIVNYMARDSFPKITSIGFYYFLILLVLTGLINLGVVYFYKYKKYKINK